VSDIQQLVDEIRDLETALDQCDDSRQEMRLKLTLASRQRELADLRSKADDRAPPRLAHHGPRRGHGGACEARGGRVGKSSTAGGINRRGLTQRKNLLYDKKSDV
jgi:hypothetical protein